MKHAIRWHDFSGYWLHRAPRHHQFWAAAHMRFIMLGTLGNTQGEIPEGSAPQGQHGSDHVVLTNAEVCVARDALSWLRVFVGDAMFGVDQLRDIEGQIVR